MIEWVSVTECVQILSEAGFELFHKILQENNKTRELRWKQMGSVEATTPELEQPKIQMEIQIAHDM